MRQFAVLVWMLKETRVALAWLRYHLANLDARIIILIVRKDTALILGLGVSSVHAGLPIKTLIVM